MHTRRVLFAIGPRRFGTLFAVLAIALAILPSMALATKTDPNADHKVTVCHRTGSEAGGNQHNGYDAITVDIASSGYVKGGHPGHDQVGNGPGGDIIPAYDAFAKSGKDWVDFHFSGKNLDTVIRGQTGQSILDAGCNFKEESSPTPTPTESPLSETTPPSPTPEVTPTPSESPLSETTPPSHNPTPPTSTLADSSGTAPMVFGLLMALAALAQVGFMRLRRR